MDDLDVSCAVYATPCLHEATEVDHMQDSTATIGGDAVQRTSASVEVITTETSVSSPESTSDIAQPRLIQVKGLSSLPVQNKKTDDLLLDKQPSSSGQLSDVNFTNLIDVTPRVETSPLKSSTFRKDDPNECSDKDAPIPAKLQVGQNEVMQKRLQELLLTSFLDYVGSTNTHANGNHLKQNKRVPGTTFHVRFDVGKPNLINEELNLKDLASSARCIQAKDSNESSFVAQSPLIQSTKFHESRSSTECSNAVVLRCHSQGFPAHRITTYSEPLRRTTPLYCVNCCNEGSASRDPRVSIGKLYPMLLHDRCLKCFCRLKKNESPVDHDISIETLEGNEMPLVSGYSCCELGTSRSSAKHSDVTVQDDIQAVCNADVMSTTFDKAGGKPKTKCNQCETLCAHKQSNNINHHFIKELHERSAFHNETDGSVVTIPSSQAPEHVEAMSEQSLDQSDDISNSIQCIWFGADKPTSNMAKVNDFCTFSTPESFNLKLVMQATSHEESNTDVSRHSPCNREVSVVLASRGESLVTHKAAIAAPQTVCTATLTQTNSFQLDEKHEQSAEECSVTNKEPFQHFSDISNVEDRNNSQDTRRIGPSFPQYSDISDDEELTSVEEPREWYKKVACSSRSHTCVSRMHMSPLQLKSRKVIGVYNTKALCGFSDNSMTQNTLSKTAYIADDSADRKGIPSCGPQWIEDELPTLVTKRKRKRIDLSSNAFSVNKNSGLIVKDTQALSIAKYDTSSFSQSPKKRCVSIEGETAKQMLKINDNEEISHSRSIPTVSDIAVGSRQEVCHMENLQAKALLILGKNEPTNLLDCKHVSSNFANDNNDATTRHCDDVNLNEFTNGEKKNELRLEPRLRRVFCSLEGELYSWPFMLPSIENLESMSDDGGLEPSYKPKLCVNLHNINDSGYLPKCFLYPSPRHLCCSCCLHHCCTSSWVPFLPGC